MFRVVTGMDAITLLRTDHQAVERLFEQFEKAGDRAFVEKRRIVDRIVEELSIHAAVEEQIFYPAARANVPDTEDIALESLEEHHIVKWLLSELDGLDPEHERFQAKVTVLIENVRHHVEEEQSDFFPKVRAAMSRTALADLGDALATAKKTAPTHPHPRSADTPPGNSVAATIAGIVDRVGDNVSGIAQGSVTAVQELVGRVTGTTKPMPSPTGSNRTRGFAASVRRTSSATIDAADQAGRAGASGTLATAKAAKAGGRGTLTSAKKSVADVGVTAKRARTTTANTAHQAVRSTKTAATKSTTPARRAASRS